MLLIILCKVMHPCTSLLMALGSHDLIPFPLQLYYSIVGFFANNIDYDLIFAFITSFFFTDKTSQHDDDDESGMGPSISTVRKSTMVSEVSYLHFPTKLCTCV